MFDRLKSLFGAEKKPAAPSRPPEQIAVAALLVEAARADERYTDKERLLISQTLAAQFDLSQEDAIALRSEAEAVQAEALDIHRFTKVAKNLSAADKIALIERLWTIILSDGERDPHEDALVRRVCGLIYVTDPQSGAARQRVEAALAGKGRR